MPQYSTRGGNDPEPRTGENRHHHKQVVDRQHFLKRITGDEQARNFRTVVDIEKPAKPIATATQKTDQIAAFFSETGLSPVHKQINKNRTDCKDDENGDCFHRKTDMC